MDSDPRAPVHVPAEPPEALTRIWAPWRSVYFATIDAGGACPFCLREAPSEDSPNDLVVARGKLCYVLMNLYPYTNGHLMVIPYRHCGALGELRPDEVTEMWALAERSTRALTRAFHAEHFNLGMNLGRGAGAGVLGHIHLHVVPRWIGDTNFMTVGANTRVISQVLEETWTLLRAAFEAEKPNAEVAEEEQR